MSRNVFPNPRHLGPPEGQILCQSSNKNTLGNQSPPSWNKWALCGGVSGSVWALQTERIGSLWECLWECLNPPPRLKEMASLWGCLWECLNPLQTERIGSLWQCLWECLNPPQAERIDSLWGCLWECRPKLIFAAKFEDFSTFGVVFREECSLCGGVSGSVWTPQADLSTSTPESHQPQILSCLVKAFIKGGLIQSLRLPRALGEPGQLSVKLSVGVPPQGVLYTLRFCEGACEALGGLVSKIPWKSRNSGNDFPWYLLCLEILLQTEIQACQRIIKKLMKWVSKFYRFLTFGQVFWSPCEKDFLP